MVQFICMVVAVGAVALGNDFVISGDDATHRKLTLVEGLMSFFESLMHKSLMFVVHFSAVVAGFQIGEVLDILATIIKGNGGASRKSS